MQDTTTKGVFSIHLFYSTLNVEELVETLVYDRGNFLAAAGGNLGLMLGISCLSVLNVLINVFRVNLHNKSSN